MSTLQIAVSRLRLRTTPGYARRWIRRNWWCAVSSLLWAAAGIVIARIAAASRPDSWAIGGEFVPCAVCWIMAARAAVRERR